LFSEIGELSTSAGTPQIPDVLLTNLKLMGAHWLIAPLLSVRCRGYGQWIDIAFEKIHEGLDDPSLRAQVFGKESMRRIIEADAVI
jgi:hypothetical protein